MLRLLCNIPINSCIVIHENIIGENQIRNFFANNGWPLTNSQLDWIKEKTEIEPKHFIFPNGIKEIVVERI